MKAASKRHLHTHPHASIHNHLYLTSAMGKVSRVIWSTATRGIQRKNERLFTAVCRLAQRDPRFRDRREFQEWALGLGLDVVAAERHFAFHGCGTLANLRGITANGLRNGSPSCQQGAKVYAAADPISAARYYGFTVVVGGSPHRLVIALSFTSEPQVCMHHGFGQGRFAYFAADASAVRCEGLVLVPSSQLGAGP